MIGATFVSPLFPLYEERYGLNGLGVTALFVVYAVFLLPTLMIVGSKGSAWGLKRVLRVSVGLSLPSTLLFLFSSEAWMLYSASDIRAPFLSFVALSAFANFTLNGIVLSLVPSYVKNVIHTSNLSISGLLILLLLGGAAFVQLIPRPAHPVAKLCTGVSLLSVGAWTTVTSGEVSNMGLLWMGMLFQTFGSRRTFQAGLQLAGGLAGPRERPRVISMFYFAAYAGFVVPSVCVGILTTFLSLNASLMILNAAVTLLVLYIVGYAPRFCCFYARQQVARTARASLRPE